MEKRACALQATLDHAQQQLTSAEKDYAEAKAKGWGAKTGTLDAEVSQHKLSVRRAQEALNLHLQRVREAV